MPIYDLTYRGWKGARTRLPAWFPILENTIRLAQRNKLLILMYRASALPVLVAIVILYIRYNFEARLGERFHGGRGQIPNYFVFDLPSYFKFLSFQGGLAILIAGIVGSGAIAGDRRGNTLETLFSRAITRGDYLWGRFLGLFSLVLGATLIPGIVIWLADNLFSQDANRLAITLAYPMKITAWALILATSSSLLILAFSALIQRAWLALATFGGFILLGTMVTQAISAIFERARTESIPDFIRGFGYFAGLAGVQRSIFGLTTREAGLSASPVSGAIMLAFLFLVSIAILRWRVRAIEVVS